MLDTEIYRSHRYAFEFSLIFIDLDHFKNVNDTHGHLVGSKLLGEIGELERERKVIGGCAHAGDPTTPGRLITP